MMSSRSQDTTPPLEVSDLVTVIGFAEARPREISRRNFILTSDYDLERASQLHSSCIYCNFHKLLHWKIRFTAGNKKTNGDNAPYYKSRNHIENVTKIVYGEEADSNCVTVIQLVFKVRVRKKNCHNL